MILAMLIKFVPHLSDNEFRSCVTTSRSCTASANSYLPVSDSTKQSRTLAIFMLGVFIGKCVGESVYNKATRYVIVKCTIMFLQVRAY